MHGVSLENILFSAKDRGLSLPILNETIAAASWRVICRKLRPWVSH